MAPKCRSDGIWLLSMTVAHGIGSLAAHTPRFCQDVHQLAQAVVIWRPGASARVCCVVTVCASGGSLRFWWANAGALRRAAGCGRMFTTPTATLASFGAVCQLIGEIAGGDAGVLAGSRRSDHRARSQRNRDDLLADLRAYLSGLI